MRYNLNSVKKPWPIRQENPFVPSRASAPRRPSYHHGELRDALIAATESILAERGVDGFSLREAARRAGVSAAAPAHHFGDATGLLTEVAILGFEGLAAALREAERAGGDDPMARLRAQGAGYVRYALAHPGRFRLMFRKALLRHEDPRLSAAGGAAFHVLEAGVRAAVGLGPRARMSAAHSAALMATWSLVHGLANLVLEGQLDWMAAQAGVDPDALFERMLPQVLRSIAVPALVAAPAPR